MTLVALAFLGGTALAANNPAPIVTAVLPGGSVSGATNVTLTVEGSGFVGNSTVDWNTTALATTFVNPHELTATLPDALIAASNTAAITVVNTTPGGGTSNSFYFPAGQLISAVNLVAAAPVGSSNMWSVATGDFNGDGIPDLATVSPYNVNVVSIFLGNGDGTFTLKGTAPVGAEGYRIVVGDFNNDGKADLAVANFSSNNVSILLGNGDGTFQSEPSLSADASPANLVAGDFNNDGHLDLAVTCANAGKVDIFLGNGDGTFTTGTPLAPGGNPWSVVVGDFNEDGFVDLAETSIGGSPNLYLGNGDGTFQAGTTLSTGSLSSRYLAVGDFNGDGHLDIAVGGGAQVGILQGDGTGAFVEDTPSADLTYSDSGSTQNAYVLTIATGDFNNDGKLDVAAFAAGDIFSATPSLMYVLTGNGDGTLNVGPGVASPSGQSNQIAVADFNGDGLLDVADAEEGSNSIDIFLNTAPVQVTPASITFPDQGQGTPSSSIAVTLTNNTGSTLVTSAVAITGVEAGDFSQTNNCTTVPSLAPAGTCTISVTFTPSALGARNAMLGVTVGGLNQLQTVPLAGNGILSTPTVSLSGPSLTFSSQGVGSTSAPQSITLSVTNAVTLNVASIAVTGMNSGDFHESDNCGSTVLGNANCSISVTFAPSAAGARSAAVTITDNAGDSPESFTLSGTGSQGTPAITWANPADIAYGTALSGTQLNASTTVGGTFAYNPPAGTVLSVGAHTLAVTFTPTDTTDYGSATGSVSVNVTKAGSTTTLPAPAASFFGDSVTLTATVASSTTGTPTGTVTFLDGTTTLGTGALNGSGVATYSTSALTVGTHNLSASYAGDANFNSSVSTAANGTVAANFSFTGAGSGPETVNPGQSASYSFTIQAQGAAMTTPVVFSATGLPAGATTTFNPTSVIPGLTASTFTLTVQVPKTAATPAAPTSDSTRFPLLPTGMAGALCLLLFAWSRVKWSWTLGRALTATACLLALAAPAVLLGGCGSGTAATPQANVVTVTGTSGALQHSMTVTLDVK